jgi:hypothetical protein
MTCPASPAQPPSVRSKRYPARARKLGCTTGEPISIGTYSSPARGMIPSGSGFDDRAVSRFCSFIAPVIRSQRVSTIDVAPPISAARPKSTHVALRGGK